MRSVEWQGFSAGRGAGAAGPGAFAEPIWWDAAGSARSQPARHLDGLLAFGEQRCAGYEVTWQLCTAADWQAERLDVRVVGQALSGAAGGTSVNRTLLLERSGPGWRSRAWALAGDELSADPAIGAPGLPGGELSLPVADVVIDSCPLSHWAPVRRLGLAGPLPSARRGGPGRPLASAHPVLRVRLPDLAVVLTRQRYVGMGALGRDRSLEHSFAGAPSVRLVVDESGVPVQFDGMARRHDTALVA